MNSLPDFFWADRLIPIEYYSYKSFTKDVIFQINAYEEKEDPAIERFHDLKRKCMLMCVDMRRQNETEPRWEKDVWDNKIVIKCKTENGSVIYVGILDFTYSIGLNVQSEREPRPYRKVEHPEELS